MRRSASINLGLINPRLKFKINFTRKFADQFPNPIYPKILGSNSKSVLPDKNQIQNEQRQGLQSPQ